MTASAFEPDDHHRGEREVEHVDEVVGQQDGGQKRARLAVERFDACQRRWGVLAEADPVGLGQAEERGLRAADDARKNEQHGQNHRNEDDFRWVHRS